MLGSGSLSLAPTFFIEPKTPILLPQDGCFARMCLSAPRSEANLCKGRSKGIVFRRARYPLTAPPPREGRGVG